MADRTALFITIGFYLAFLLGVAVFSYIRGKQAVRDGDADAHVNEHFLASSSFGTIVLFLTTFSTIVSGYTAFNIPSETAGIGFIAMRWLTGFVMIVLGYTVYAPRYRRIAIARNWQSPNDIIADKYNCNSLRLLGAFVQCFPLLLYISVQFISLELMIEQVSDGQISGEAAVWFLVFFIWVCEFIGGFRGVSLTDAIQSAFMLIAFLGIPILLADLYGGFIGINAFPTCDNIVPFPLSSSGFIGCIGVTSFFFNFYPPVGQSDVSTGGWGDFNPAFSAPGIAGCQAIVATGNTSNPSFAACAGVVGTAAAVDAQALFSYVPVGILSFSIALMVSGAQVHWAQRIISAKSDLVVKKSLMLTSTCIMFAPIPGLMLGLTRASNHPGSGDAFPTMVAVFFDNGGFQAFFSVLMSVSAVAAFMSTADSAAIGVANVITVEVFQNFLTPNMSQKATVYTGKFISLVTLVSSRAILYADIDILTALNWQIGLGWAVVPTWGFALFGSDKLASAYALLLGMFAHYILLFSLEFGVIEGGNNIYLYSGIYCTIVNVVVTYVANKILPSSLKDDANRTKPDGVIPAARERFGGGKIDHLTYEKITEIMKDTTEPIATRLGQFCVVSAFIILVFSLPWWGKDGWDSTLDTSNPDSLIAGLPPWAFNLAVCSGVEFFLLIFALSLWKTEKMDTELKSAELK